MLDLRILLPCFLPIGVRNSARIGHSLVAESGRLVVVLLVVRDQLEELVLFLLQVDQPEVALFALFCGLLLVASLLAHLLAR